MKKLLPLLFLFSSLFGYAGDKITPAYNDTLKIISWNIHMLPYSIYAKGKKPKRAKLIAEMMNESDYNIIVFQEAFQIKSRRILRKRLKEKYPYMYGPANYKWLSAKTNSGVWILSDRPLIVKGTVEFDEAEGSSVYARKGAMMIEGEHKGHLFQIVGTHTNGSPQEINRHQFHIIYDGLLEPYEKEGVPQLICGDMNCNMAVPHYYEAMLRIYHAEDTPRDGGLDWSNYRKDKIIDYILVRKNESKMRQIRKRILHPDPDYDHTLGRRFPEGLSYSDHRPVEIWLVFD